MWFNKSAGVFASAIFATLQYNIVNSQIARMYGFGIFFVLLATYCISLYIRRSERIHYLALILYVLSATIAAYSHYFSFLCIGIITLSVWLIEKAPKRNAVLIAVITSYSIHYTKLYDDAKFTYDATAAAKRRDDYFGGVTENQKSFVLKNCGFFDENVSYGAIFNREKSSGKHPVIDFETLPEK